MGKAPQLVTADGRMIVESSAIASYLIDTYDTAGKFKGDSKKNDKYRDEELSSLSGSSIGPNVLIWIIWDDPLGNTFGNPEALHQT